MLLVLTDEVTKMLGISTDMNRWFLLHTIM